MQDFYTNFEQFINYLKAEQSTIYGLLVFLTLGLTIFIITFIIRKTILLFRSRSPNLIDGFLIIFNFSTIVFWVILSASILNFDSSVILGGSVFTITLIGISASYLGSNLMGGLFIIVTRPFGVGDIITYSGAKGLVSEIGLNYTKVLKLNKEIIIIPNSNIVNALVHNSSIFIKHEQQVGNEIEFEISEEHNNKKTQEQSKTKAFLTFSSNKLAQPLLNSFNIRKLIRFSFSVELRQDLLPNESSIEELQEKLKSLCNEFTAVFGFEPTFFFEDNYWRVSTTFIITAPHAKVIFDNHSSFLEGIISKIYNIKVEDN